MVASVSSKSEPKRWHKEAGGVCLSRVHVPDPTQFYFHWISGNIIMLANLTINKVIGLNVDLGTITLLSENDV